MSKISCITAGKHDLSCGFANVWEGGRILTRYYQEEKFMGKKRTSLEVYLSVVFKWGLLILVSACMCATATFVTEKLIGLYPTVPWIAVLLFACMDICFFAAAVYRR